MGGDDDGGQVERDPFEGADRTEGFEAERELANEARKAKHAKRGGADPIEGLIERIKNEKRPELAFDGPVLDEALDMRADEIAAFQALRRGLKSVGVTLKQWDSALDALAKRRREAEDEAARKRRAQTVAAQRDARDRDAEAAAAERARAAAEAPEELRAHFPEPITINGANYCMEPGRTWCERWKGNGDNAVLVEEDLAMFSARITSHVHEVTSPGATPRTVFEVSLHAKGEKAPRVVLVPTEEFRRMDWIETRAPGATVLETGRREHLRIAMESLSPGAERKRRFCYRSTGWFEHEGGEPVYVTAGGAIGSSGYVAGVRTEPCEPGDVVRLFALPSTVGSDKIADLRAVARLLEIEPAHVAMPCLGLAFRSVIGGASNAVHIWGTSQVGKSRLASMYWRLFGPEMHFKNPPASWFSDSTATILSRMSRIGNGVLGVSDMQPDTPSANVDVVFRSLFNNAAPGRMKREGGERERASLRASILSDGERSVRGPSLPSRVATVFLDRRFTPDPGTLTREPEGCLEDLAASGAFARGMAHFIESYAPRYAKNLARLPTLEREVCAKWDLRLSDRSAEVFAPLALGIEQLLRVLRAAEIINDDELAAHRRRAAEALTTAAAASREGADEQRPGVVALKAIGAAIRSRMSDGAHVGATRLSNGRRKPSPPPHPERWGYTLRGNDKPTEMGACVGYRTWEDPSVVVLDLAVALSVVKRWAPRVCGVESPVGTDRELHEAFKALGRAAKREEGRPEGKARIATGELTGGGRLEGFPVSPADLGIDITDDPPADESEPGADNGPDNPADDEFGRYRDYR